MDCSSPKPYQIESPDMGSPYQANEQTIKSLKAGQHVYRTAESGATRTFRCSKREIWVDGDFRGTESIPEPGQGKPIVKYTRLGNGGLRAEFYGIKPFELPATNDCFGWTDKLFSDLEPVTEAKFHASN